MELREFISESLKQIIAGVKQARDYAKGDEARINPSVTPRPGSLYHMASNTHLQDIEFDVAVTVTEEKEKAGKISVLAGIFGGEAGGQSRASNASISRIKFSVPVVLPADRS